MTDEWSKAFEPVELSIAPAPVSEAHYGHQLTKFNGFVRCSICHQKWRSKPTSHCPGAPVYDWGAIPDGLAPFDVLFGKGLRLADGQKPAAYAGTQRREPLYALADCVPHGIDITFDEGKYKFRETPLGFEIWRVNGLHVGVWYEDTYLVVDERGAGRRKSGPILLGLYNWPYALRQAALAFAEALVSDDVKDAGEMISKALSYRFYQGWERIKSQIAPKEIADLARLMYASAQTDADVLHDATLYTDAHQHTRADLRKYHACRMYAANGAKLEDVARWRERLSPTVPNKALNKTLDKMATGVSFKQITRLSTIRLQAPVTNRLHLIFILCASDHHNWGLHERAVVSATPAMIQEVGTLFRRTLNGRSRTVVIGDVARRVLDYPQPYGGDLLGLARLSQQWHAQMGERDDNEGPGMLPADTPLVVPQGVDLAALEVKGVRLLRTAGDCYDEHTRMKHCIHTYASKAATGGCYLFHVDYKPEEGEASEATIEVSPSRVVVQAEGPYNRKNAACEYGVKVLKEAFGQKE